MPDLSFQMTVEDVFSIRGRGTVVTGCIESGVVQVGDTIEIRGASITHTVVSGIEMFRKTTKQAQAGDTVGLLLRNVTHEQVQRGDVLRGTLT
jgi:elongation factor Tu